MVEKYLFANNNGYVYTGKEILQRYEFQLDSERKPFWILCLIGKPKKSCSTRFFPPASNCFEHIQDSYTMSNLLKWQQSRTNYLLHRFAVFASRVRIKEDFGRTSSLFHVSGKELSPSKPTIKFDACSPGVKLRSDSPAKSLHL